jgi:hypothetical protein
MSEDLKEIIAKKVQLALLEGCKYTKKTNEAEEDDELDDDAVEEMSVRRAAVIGGLVGGPVGAMVGGMYAKGKQHTLDDQIRAAEKKSSRLV